jgi:RNA recognition motif-containing protein
MALFVGKLNSRVRHDDLVKAFGKFGKLKSRLVGTPLRLPAADHNLPAGTMSRCELKGSFAFVTYETETSADNAIKELHESDLCGAKINVEHTRDSGKHHRQAGRTSFSFLLNPKQRLI